MKSAISFSLLLALLLSSCIGDDIIDDLVEPRLTIDNPLDTLGVGASYQYTTTYLNNVGQAETIETSWITSNPLIVSIDSNGLATAHDTGAAVITVIGENGEGLTLSAENQLVAGAETVVAQTQRRGLVSTTSSYELSGEFTLAMEGNDLKLEFFDDYVASTALPGLYVYLTNNPNTSAGAYEIGAVSVFSGAHSYTIPNAGLSDYSHVLYFCKPFNVKVGDGLITE